MGDMSDVVLFVDEENGVDSDPGEEATFFRVMLARCFFPAARSLLRKSDESYSVNAGDRSDDTLVFVGDDKVVSVGRLLTSVLGLLLAGDSIVVGTEVPTIVGSGPSSVSFSLLSETSLSNASAARSNVGEEDDTRRVLIGETANLCLALPIEASAGPWISEGMSVFMVSDPEVGAASPDTTVLSVAVGEGTEAFDSLARTSRVSPVETADFGLPAGDNESRRPGEPLDRAGERLSRCCWNFCLKFDSSAPSLSCVVRMAADVFNAWSSCLRRSRAF